MYTYFSPEIQLINLKLYSSSTFLKFKNKNYLLCRIVCGKNSPSHSRCKNKVSCDMNSVYLQSFHHRRPKNDLRVLELNDIKLRGGSTVLKS
jgi:hypothetical protein